MKLYKYLLMLPLAFMAASCSDENEEFIVEEEETPAAALELKAAYWPEQSRWTPGQTIKYYISRGTDAQVKLLEECMEDWCTSANIRFEKTRREKQANIKFYFDDHTTKLPCHQKPCSSHYIGRSSSSMPIFIYTLLLKDNNQLRAQILHELGHVLGLHDEFQSVNFKYHFDKDRMVKDFMAEENVNEHNQIWHLTEPIAIATYEADYADRFGNIKLNCTKFDLNSIMMLDLPSKWLKERCIIKRLTKISGDDRSKIKELYPYGDLVKLYYGSTKNSDGTYNDAVITTYGQFSDKSKIRGFAGYGLDKSKSQYHTSKMKEYNGVAMVYSSEGNGRLPIVRYYNSKTKRYVNSTAEDQDYLASLGYSPIACVGAMKSDASVNADGTPKQLNY